MEFLSKLEESALAKFDQGDFNGAISDLSKVRHIAFDFLRYSDASAIGNFQPP
jgi:hypothetical protein